MVKVITYGTFDLLHYGHIRLLERAKALGDYLIVGVTSDDYDKTRGKINNHQPLMVRVESVRATGIADEILIEEYEGQKIDDIRKYDIDIFTVGSDWKGFFDYLNEYCRVVYLPRTDGISSTELRNQKRSVRLGIIGDSRFINKVWRESKTVNGIHIEALCTNRVEVLDPQASDDINIITDDLDTMLECVDAVYIRSVPESHYEHIKKALDAQKHVLCESPITTCESQTRELIELAERKGLVLMEAVKTAYATAYARLLLLIKAGKIGDVISVDSTCTSIRQGLEKGEWKSIYEWGPTALIPVFQILGTEYRELTIATRFGKNNEDSFTRMNFVFEKGCGSIKIGDGFKSEGELIVSGSKGYIYVPAPWWKTEYFEVRFENQNDNMRYFYQLDGEGISYELVVFARAIETGGSYQTISRNVTLCISGIMEKFIKRENMTLI